MEPTINMCGDGTTLNGFHSSAMKVAGHTMGTPDMSVDEAIAFCGRIGLDGIDLICTDDYRCAVPLDLSDGELRRLKDQMARAGIELANLTPYAKRLNSPERAEREQNLAIMRQAIELAARAGCRSLRAWSGDIVPGEDLRRGWDHAVAGMRAAARIAEDHDVTLNLENHINTLTPTVALQLAMLDEINSPNVLALLDAGCLTMEPGAEDGVTAARMLQGRLGFVHVKDVIVSGRREPLHVLVGQGETGWAGVLQELQSTGYDGYLSLEYERRWHPDMLPEPEIGMVESLRFVRTALAGGKA